MVFRILVDESGSGEQNPGKCSQAGPVLPLPHPQPHSRSGTKSWIISEPMPLNKCFWELCFDSSGFAVDHSFLATACGPVATCSELPFWGAAPSRLRSVNGHGEHKQEQGSD